MPPAEQTDDELEDLFGGQEEKLDRQMHNKQEERPAEQSLLGYELEVEGVHARGEYQRQALGLSARWLHAQPHSC